MKLTKRTIDGLVYEGDGNRRDVRWDDDLHGFGVRVYPSGRRAYVVSYRVHGRKRLMTLGATTVLTLDQARSRAQKYLVSVGDGDDPLEIRRRAANGETINDLCKTYMDRHAKQRKRSWKDDERRIERHIKPAWGNLKVVALKRSDVATLHTRIGGKNPYEANRTVRLVSKIFELAQRWGFVPDEHANPAKGIELYREQKRDRWVTPEELPKLAEAIDEEANEAIKAALWLYLLTGTRRSELLAARWGDLDWERKELRLPETKAGRIHYVPLSEPALALLRKLPQEEDCPYIFPSPKSGTAGTGKDKHAQSRGHLVNVSKPWQRVRDRATVKLWMDSPDERISGLVTQLQESSGRIPTRQEVEQAAGFDLPRGLQDVRLHDLRRTVGSWLAQAGNSLHLIGRVLNHSSTNTTAIYARFGEDHVRLAMEQHAKRIMGIAGKADPAVVVDIAPKLEHAG